MRESNKTKWDQLRAQKDSEIDFSDIPETDEDFWNKADIVFPTKKVHLSIRLDEDIVAWFKQFGRGYQSRINAILKSYIKTLAKQKRTKVDQI